MPPCRPCSLTQLGGIIFLPVVFAMLCFGLGPVFVNIRRDHYPTVFNCTVISSSGGKGRCVWDPHLFTTTVVLTIDGAGNKTFIVRDAWCGSPDCCAENYALHRHIPCWWQYPHSLSAAHPSYGASPSSTGWTVLGTAMIVGILIVFVVFTCIVCSWWRPSETGGYTGIRQQGQPV